MFRDSNEVISLYMSNHESVKTDFLKRENSNFVYSISGLRHNVNNLAEEKFLFDHVFPPDLVELYNSGVVYIHDRKLAPYCVSVSCKEIASLGVPSLAKNMLESKAPKRLGSLLRHFSNVVTLMSQQVAGAVMLSQMTTVSASYMHYEEEVAGTRKYDDDLVKQLFQYMIWELNMPLRAGHQSAFSNITLEFGHPSPDVANDFVVIGGTVQDYKYSDIPPKFFDRVNKAIIDVMADGSGRGIPFTFPLITIPVYDTFDYGNNLFLYLLDKMYHFGGVYFENFTTDAFSDPYYRSMNPMIKPKDIETSRSMCCRLHIDMSLLSKVGSGVFGSSVGNTGAVQVLNLNMNRVLMEYGKDFEMMLKKIREYMEVMQSGHMAKRGWLEENRDLFPTFFAYNHDLRNYFNVFAVTGMHEGMINLGYKDGLLDVDAQVLAHKLMQHVHQIIDDFIVRDKVACGLEYAPAESACVKMARDDVRWARERGMECFVQGYGDSVFLTSGCMLPFSSGNFLDQVENASQFQSYATSGSILHHFLESVIQPQLLSQYIKNLFKKPINYVTLTPTLTNCMSCGKQMFAVDAVAVGKCPDCGSDDLATFSRVIGYVKMISRKNVRVSGKMYEGDYNFWSDARRVDWGGRKRLSATDLFNVGRG